ncbi:membrane protein insertase YidC [Anaerolineales bacterium HSG24]|nr:membrane protein insertase YidC [Anaerolineales bacterium HSG24]
MQFIKYWSILLFGLGLVVFITVYDPVNASSQPLAPTNQENDGIIENVPSLELVNLGEIFSYSITITNNGSSTVDSTMADDIPAELILLPDTVSATIGVASVEGQTISWQGDLASGEDVEIIYNTIPSSLGAADIEISNIASLTFGDNQIQSVATVTTQEGYYGIIWMFLNPFVKGITWALILIDSMLQQTTTPYTFGFAIILFTVTIRGVTFPLNMQQIKSSKAMQELQPQLKALQEKYKDNREELAMAQMNLYKEAGVNPLGGCLPMLIQMPIWISLYWALVQLSLEGALTEGFFWIPSLGGPVAYREASFGWLYPFPPSIGWGPALSYLILPVLLVVSQMYMQQMMTPPSTDPQQAQMQTMMKFMPLMFGYFALIVPAGLTLYWFTNNILMVVQQYFTKTHLEPAAPPTAEASDPSPPAKTKPAKTKSANTKPKEGRKTKHARNKSRRKR